MPCGHDDPALLVTSLRVIVRSSSSLLFPDMTWMLLSAAIIAPNIVIYSHISHLSPRENAIVSINELSYSILM